jgi:hypothetical protein
MKHPDAQSIPMPPVKRPSEAVVYWTLFNLCGGKGGTCSISMRKLATCCKLAISTTNRAVLNLTKRQLIQYQAGCNQSQPSVYQIPKITGAKQTPTQTAAPKIGTPNPNDNDTLNNFIYDLNDRYPVHNQKEDSDKIRAERLAYRVAEGLEDLKNLALYKNYCRKFPPALILKAYVEAKQTSQQKIKVSRGALFNFLVQLYAKQNS